MIVVVLRFSAESHYLAVSRRSGDSVLPRISLLPGSRHVMPDEMEAELALAMVSQYAERRISSLAERANLLAKHAKGRTLHQASNP